MWEKNCSIDRGEMVLSIKKTFADSRICNISEAPQLIPTRMAETIFKTYLLDFNIKSLDSKQ